MYSYEKHSATKAVSRIWAEMHALSMLKMNVDLEIEDGVLKNPCMGACAFPAFSTVKTCHPYLEIWSLWRVTRTAILHDSMMEISC